MEYSLVEYYVFSYYNLNIKQHNQEQGRIRYD